MFCPNCGNKLEDSAKFCPYCGEKTEQAADIPAIPVTDANPEDLGYPNLREENTSVAPPPVKVKKGGKGKAVIIALVVLLVAAAGAVAAIFLLGDKGGASPAQGEQVKINNDCLLYSKDGRLYLTYSENNQKKLLSTDFAHGGADSFARDTVLPCSTYYNEETGYLYFPDKMKKEDYTVKYRLSRIKLDPENIEASAVEAVVDDWINYGGGYRVSPDDSLIIYKNDDNDLYYRNLGTEEEAQRLEKEISNLIVDFDKNHCYYNDDTEVTYVNLETMEKKVIFSDSANSYIYIDYAGDSVMLRANDETYLLDKNGDKTYLSKGGYMQQIGDKYYYIDYSGYEDAERPAATLFVTDDCLDADSKLTAADEGYNEKLIRDRIRNIVSYETIYAYATDEIYLIEGGEAELVMSDVSSYSQGGTEATSCYHYNDPSKIITVSEIYSFIGKRYPNVMKGAVVEDYYVTAAILNAYENHKVHYIIVNGVASVIDADDINYIESDVWYGEDCVYFCMSTGSYTDEDGYDMYNPAKIYKAAVNANNTLGQYELVSEGSITFLDGENLFYHGELETDEDSDEWSWYTYYGDLYKNGTLIDNGVYICYAESMTDDFNEYRGGKVLYVKNLELDEESYTADLYYYNGTESVKLEKEVDDYELSAGGAVYYLDDGEFIRYGAEGNTTVDSDVDFLFAAEMYPSTVIGW